MHCTDGPGGAPKVLHERVQEATLPAKSTTELVCTAVEEKQLGLTGSISFSVTSTATLLLIIPIVSTTRKSFFMRSKIPSVPAIAPDRMRTFRARGQVWMRLNLHLPQAVAKPIDITIWNGRRLRSKANNRSYPRNLKNGHATAAIYPNKKVAGKQRELQHYLRAVSPLALLLVQGNKGLNHSEIK